MAKQLSSKQKKEELNKLFALYNKRLGRLYSDYVKKLTSLGYSEDVLEGDALFNFNNFPELKTRLDDIFANYFADNVLCYKQGITDGVALAFSHDTATFGTFSVLSDKAIKTVRDNAAATFIQSRFKAAKGLNLSQTIWNYCQQTKSEFEMAMSNVIADGVKGGTSAEEIGRRIRQYLNNPDMMYRRYHTVKILANGTKKDVVSWRRKRIIDGKVRFIEEPLEKVGRGVYRSSRMNALRVARTEINAAYLRGHNARWTNEPFVIGQWIHVSPQHPVEDICDELEGRYPKDFVFSNWHPQCMCTSDPILIEGEEKKKFYDRLYAGEDMSGYISPYAVTDVPEQYKKYIESNEDAIMDAFRRGKLAWHLADNKRYWQRLCSAENQKKMGYSAKSAKKLIFEAARKRHAGRTREQIDKIQSKWTMRRSAIYLERMNDSLDILKMYDSNFIAKDALLQRYNNVLSAIKNKSSVDDVERTFTRFTDGVKTREDIFKRLAPQVLQEQKAIFKERFKPFKSDLSIYQGEIKKLYDNFNKCKDGYKAKKILDELREQSLTLTKDMLSNQGKVDGLQYVGTAKDYVISKARTFAVKGKLIDIKEYVADFVCFEDKAGIRYYYETFGYGNLARFNAKEMSEYFLDCPKYVRENIKGMMSCNSWHPLDDYYKKAYKSFTHGYMYSSNPVTVHSTASIEQAKTSVTHEIGHHIDHKMGIISRQAEWKQAMQLDKGYIREYSKNDPMEDFADTISYYAQGGGYKQYIERNFPNRTKLLEKLLNSL